MKSRICARSASGGSASTSERDGGGVRGRGGTLSPGARPRRSSGVAPARRVSASHASRSSSARAATASLRSAPFFGRRPGVSSSGGMMPKVMFVG